MAQAYLSPPTPKPMSVPAITVEALAAARAEDREPALLDVRQFEERAIASLGGVHIPLGELPERAGELEGFRGQPLIVYCRSGARSARAAEWLRTEGFDAHNLAGGTLAWSRSVDPALPTY